MEGYSQEEIARMIKRPVGTVKARISRGRAILRNQLEKAAGDEKPLAAQEIFNG
jgi:RNA polymerase sigma-70 factor (ECF subfamily)